MAQPVMAGGAISGRVPGLLVLLALLVPLALLAAPARAGPMVADLSSHLIAIDSGFTGSEVLLYGALDGEGDVIVVVTGPEESVTVRRKDRVVGIWMNRESMQFDGVPAFYTVAASRPLAEIAEPALLALHRIGIDALDIRPAGEYPPEQVAPFREALVRNRVRDGLYTADLGDVSFLGGRLFRTLLKFPANVPTGTYRAEVLLFRGGEVISAEATPLFVNKTGFQAEVNYFAHELPAYYGIAAILLALFAGWLAAVVFRKV